MMANSGFASLAEAMVERHGVSLPDLERAQRASKESDIPFDRVLNQLGIASDQSIADCWRHVTGLPVIAEGQSNAELDFLGLLPITFLRNSRCLPWDVRDGRVCLAMENPADPFPQVAISTKLGLPVDVHIITSSRLSLELDRLESKQGAIDVVASSALDDATDDLDRLRDLASDAPVIRFVNAAIDQAVSIRASDIHITREQRAARLRYRIDGVLRDFAPPPPALYPAIISRIKIMAGLDIAERRLPQDGRIRVASSGRELDLRVATMPHAHGEGIVLRLLDKKAVALDFESLGLSPSTLHPLSSALSSPNGLVLVTGPTGSGKTTTLYSALRTLKSDTRNILTVEDPIEYHLEGINQIQISRKIGLDFSTILRAALRQDPDVIMVGEIRDSETAVVATQAALTGHLVLATVHTNTAAGSLPRLIDMGVEPFLLASCFRGALAQRLVRRLCSECKTQAPTPLNLVSTGKSITHFLAVGCSACAGSGYHGRLAISEFLSATDRVRNSVLKGADANAIGRVSESEGATSLHSDGLRAVEQGLTTMAEILRVGGEG